MNIEEMGLTVLLLASQARLLELFRSLEAQGVMQLEVASSITDAERLLSKNPPDFTFIQSRISALSGEIVVRHIRSFLTHDSKVVLLSGDDDELKRAPGLQVVGISLGGSDASLSYAIREMLLAAEPPEERHEAAPTPGGEEGDAIALLPPEEPPPAAEVTPLSPPPTPSREEEKPSAAPSVSSFEEALRAHQVHEPQPLSHMESERHISHEAPHKAPRKRRSAVMAPARSLRDFASKNYLSPHRLQRRSVLIVGALIICAAAAGIYSLIPAKRALMPLPPRPAAQAPAPPAAPALPPTGAAPKLDEAVVPETPPAHSASKKGLTDLPPFVVDAEQDTEYGKTHPGWERYQTPRMEYKIFREGPLIKAVQIMAARDETVPSDLFNWAKKEFAATGPYKLASKEKKGNYQLEKWQGDGAGLTVYRKVPELKMRALVLYYR